MKGGISPESELNKMAHQVESMFFVGETPWHGLGYNFGDEAPNTIPEAMNRAGLDWKVTLNDIYTEVNGEKVKIEDNKATVRESDGSILGVVGSRYTPLQNVEAFETFQPFLDSNEASFETAGSLQNGRRVWALAKINRPNSVIVKGDEIRKYVLLSHGHDGTMSIHYGLTPVRVVCANTLAMATTGSSSQLMKFRHTKNAKLALNEATEVINLANACFEATADQYKVLAKKACNKKMLEQYVRIVFGIGEDIKTEDISTRTQNQMAQVYNFFDQGRGNQLKGVKGTLWAAYNAVTEQMNHNAGHSKETRFNSLWFGPNQKANQNALHFALQLAA